MPSVDHIAAAMRQETEMEEWISVKERLPEPGLDSLVYDGAWQEVASWDGEEWENCEGSVVSVTHWQPLPAPPSTPPPADVIGTETERGL